MRILGRIEAKGAAIQRLVQRCLTFIDVTEGMLNVTELQQAVSIDDETDTLDDESIVDDGAILEHCSSLICRQKDDQGMSHIDFSHFSVVEYLQGPSLLNTNLRSFHISPTEGKRTVAIAFLQTLLLDQMSYRPTGTIKDYEYIADRTKRYPLYRFACLMWPVYAKDHLKDKAVWSLICCLFDPRKNDAFCSWSLEMYLFSLVDHGLRWQGEEPQSADTVREGVKEFGSLVLHQGFTTLHIAAALGLYDICLDLVRKGVDPNALCILGSPLHFAVSPRWFSGLRVEKGEIERHNDGFLLDISMNDRRLFRDERPLIVDLSSMEVRFRRTCQGTSSSSCSASVWETVYRRATLE
jgi:hypothetical protein